MRGIYPALKYFFVCLALLLFLSVPSPSFAYVNEAEAASAVNHTAFNLYRRLSGNADNFCFSPYSISTVFAMTYAGAREETAREIERAFMFSDGIHTSNGRLVELITSPPDGAGEFRSANSIWPQYGYRISRAYRTILRDDYLAEPTPLDFEKKPDRAREEINDWVSAETNDKIEDLIPEGSIDSDTRMVLVNAVYMKAPWLQPFDDSKTEMKPFMTPNGIVSAKTMAKTESMSFAENEVARSVRIPYRQGMFSMTILLPRDDVSMILLEESLSKGFIEDINASEEKRLVDLRLPAFKVESDFELTNAVKSIGVTSAFDPARADFSGINGRRNLFIGATVHRAFIEVDENGTEAAAATAVAMSRGAMPVETEAITFEVDRPFIFIVRDEIAGAILFIGRVNEPRS